MIATLCQWCLNLMGWTVEANLPPTNKYVIIAYPHTSNWDFPIALLTGAAVGLRINWLGKNTLFTFPFGWLMRALGGIPVDRSQSHNMVEAMIAVFEERERFVPVIPPEATRGFAKRWKTGFYHIAQGAHVPIACGFLDFQRKVGGVKTYFMPSGNIQADMEILRTVYAGIEGKYPEKASPIRID